MEPALVSGTDARLKVRRTHENYLSPLEETRYDQTGASDQPTHCSGIHSQTCLVRRRIFEEWLTFDHKLSLARFVRRAPLEEAIKLDPRMLEEFQAVLAGLCSQEVALTLDFSSLQRTYMDLKVPSIQEQLEALSSVTGKLSILAFNLQDCHPSVFVELGKVLIGRPDLLPIIKSAPVHLPRDMIWRLHPMYQRAVLSPPSRAIPILWDAADVSEFIHGLVCKFEGLNDGNGAVDPVHLIRAIYMHACTWKPSSGNDNFILRSWGLAWGKRHTMFKQFQKLLENGASLQEFRKAGAR